MLLLPFRLVLPGVPSPLSLSSLPIDVAGRVVNPRPPPGIHLYWMGVESLVSSGAYDGRFRGMDGGGNAEVGVLPPNDHGVGGAGLLLQ